MNKFLSVSSYSLARRICEKTENGTNRRSVIAKIPGGFIAFKNLDEYGKWYLAKAKEKNS